MNKRQIDWHKDELTPKTIITANYRTTQNVRRFFHEQMGREVRLGRDFMNWMHTCTGKTLGHALRELKARNRPGK